MNKGAWWRLKRAMFGHLVQLSNAAFGKEITHRSRIAKSLNGLWLVLAERFFPARRRQARFEKANPGLPWFVPDAILEIEKFLKPGYKGFEWGCGRSTLWFARHVAHVTSVEGRRDWFDMTGKMIAQGGLQHKIQLILAEVTTEHDFHPHEIERYASAIDRFGDHSLDFVVVDGHFREACLRRIGNKLRQGGLLVIDNSEVVPASVLDALPGVDRSSWNNGIWETTLIRQP